MASNHYTFSEYSQYVDSRNREDFFKKLVILPELANLLPPHDGSELEQSILSEGVRDDLTIWFDNGKFILLDGHTRLKIIEKHSLDFKVNMVYFENINEAKEWILVNQMLRRNLTSEERSYANGVLAKLRGVPFVVENAKVSRRTVYNDQNFAAAVDSFEPSLKHDVLSGKLPVNKGDIMKLPTDRKWDSADDIKEYLDDLAKKEVKKPTTTDILTPSDPNTGDLFEKPIGFKIPKILEKLEETSFYLVHFSYNSPANKLQEAVIAGVEEEFSDIKNRLVRLDSLELFCEKIRKIVETANERNTRSAPLEYRFRESKNLGSYETKNSIIVSPKDKDFIYIKFSKTNIIL